MNLVVRTYAGFEDILSEEIIKITGTTPKIGKRAVYLEGDLKIIYQLNLYCRLALDVLVELHHYKAKNEDELYKGALKHDWSNEFSIQETFSLNSVVHSPFFNHSKYASLKIKEFGEKWQRDIDALKNEVAMLRRKGGYVYTPVVNQVQAQNAVQQSQNSQFAASAPSNNNTQ